MRIWRVLAVALTAFSFVVLVPSASFACSCAQGATEEHVDNADLVVSGTVLDRHGPGFRLVRSSSDPVTYTVEVDHVYKGRSGPVTRIVSAASGASCGLEVQTGGEYVIFAHESEGGTVRASLCGGTAPADPALVDAVTAETGAEPVPPDRSLPAPAADIRFARGGVGGLAAAALTVGAIAAGGVAVFRRRRSVD